VSTAPQVITLCGNGNEGNQNTNQDTKEINVKLLDAIIHSLHYYGVDLNVYFLELIFNFPVGKLLWSLSSLVH
jgi:hypothetical protein